MANGLLLIILIVGIGWVFYDEIYGAKHLDKILVKLMPGIAGA